MGIMKVKLAFCMGNLRVKCLKIGSFPRHMPVLLTIGSAPPFLPGPVSGKKSVSAKLIVGMFEMIHTEGIMHALRFVSRY